MAEEEVQYWLYPVAEDVLEVTVQRVASEAVEEVEEVEVHHLLPTVLAKVWPYQEVMVEVGEVLTVVCASLYFAAVAGERRQVALSQRRP